MAVVWWVAGGGLGMCRGESGVGVSLGGVGIRVVGFWVVCCMGLGNFDGRWLFLGAWYLFFWRVRQSKIQLKRQNKL